MDIATVAKELNLRLVSGSDRMKNNVTGGYTGDLLSDVMANSHGGDIWITRQVHQNIVAVATLKDHAGIILVNSCEPAKDTLEKAVQENVPILISNLTAFETTGKIYNLLNAANNR
ncbi:MAG: serine kinase [Deltaproteobacteria bacterium]|nr:serine kinase [Deltaproteobacteria bacterium]